VGADDQDLRVTADADQRLEQLSGAKEHSSVQGWAGRGNKKTAASCGFFSSKSNRKD